MPFQPAPEPAPGAHAAPPAPSASSVGGVSAGPSGDAASPWMAAGSRIESESLPSTYFAPRAEVAAPVAVPAPPPKPARSNQALVIVLGVLALGAVATLVAIVANKRASADDPISIGVSDDGMHHPTPEPTASATASASASAPKRWGKLPSSKPDDIYDDFDEDKPKPAKTPGKAPAPAFSNNPGF
jgi:hypothetical protein